MPKSFLSLWRFPRNADRSESAPFARVDIADAMMPKGIVGDRNNAPIGKFQNETSDDAKTESDAAKAPPAEMPAVYADSGPKPLTDGEPRKQTTLWVAASLVLAGAAGMAGFYLGQHDRPGDEASRQRAPAAAPPVRIEPFPTPQSFVLAPGVERTALRAGPGTDFVRTGEVRAGSEITGYGREKGMDGLTWISVASRQGSGFILEDALERRLKKPEVSASPSVKPSATRSARPARPKAVSIAKRVPTVIRPSPNRQRAATTGARKTIICIYPDGREARASYDSCRSRAGVVYR